MRSFPPWSGRILMRTHSSLKRPKPRFLGCACRVTRDCEPRKSTRNGIVNIAARQHGVESRGFEGTLQCLCLPPRYRRRPAKLEPANGCSRHALIKPRSAPECQLKEIFEFQRFVLDCVCGCVCVGFSV